MHFNDISSSVLMIINQIVDWWLGIYETTSYIENHITKILLQKCLRITIKVYKTYVIYHGGKCHVYIGHVALWSKWDHYTIQCRKCHLTSKEIPDIWRDWDGFTTAIMRIFIAGKTIFILKHGPSGVIGPMSSVIFFCFYSSLPFQIWQVYPQHSCNGICVKYHRDSIKITDTFTYSKISQKRKW